MSDSPAPSIAQWLPDARRSLKWITRAVFTVAVLPFLVSFWVRRLVLGPDRALEGSSQTLALFPGIPGQYMRRAFLARALASCHHTATVEFGTIFSQSRATLGRNVYIGPNCHLGLVHIEDDALLGPSVHVPSGPFTHGFADPTIPIREQKGERLPVRIGAGTWIGSNAVVMADIGHNCVIGAGSVVTAKIPASVVAAGSPARVLQTREEYHRSTHGEPHGSSGSSSQSR